MYGQKAKKKNKHPGINTKLEKQKKSQMTA